MEQLGQPSHLQEIEQLRSQLESANRTIAAMMDRIEATSATLVVSAGINLNTLVLQDHVRKQTAELHRINSGLTAAVTARRRSDRILSKMQQITKVAGWELDVPTETLHLTEQVNAILDAELPLQTTVPVLCRRFDASDVPTLCSALAEAHTSKSGFDLEIAATRADQSRGLIRVVGQPLIEGDEVASVYGVMMDITERKEAERQAVISQHLESIGQLAAGIAHEINTPTQFVSDNVRFLQTEFSNVLAIVEVLHGELTGPSSTWQSRRQNAEAAMQSFDFEFLCREIPLALSQSLEGLDRVAQIVRAMKEFSHPGSSIHEPVDLNRWIRSTVEVSRNRWKYVADLELDLAPDLPPVPCLVGEFNQVILNLIVNAADAITEKLGPNASSKGKILVRTRIAGNSVEIRIQDDGSGISEKNKQKIFHQFFTTKPVGKGTGQGLAISRNVIVKKHGGQLTFESREGAGTTFIIRLPTSSSSIPGVAA